MPRTTITMWRRFRLTWLPLDYGWRTANSAAQCWPICATRRALREGKAITPFRMLIYGWISREGMGSSRNLEWHNPVPEVRQLIRYFQRVANAALPKETLAALYAYESQVP